MRSAFESHELLIIVLLLIVVLNRNAAKEETLLWNPSNTPGLTSRDSFFPLSKTELLTRSFLHVGAFLIPPRSSVAFQKNNTNYCDSEQLHIMTASTSTVLRCKCTKEKSLLGNITICCLNAAETKKNKKTLGQASSGKLKTQTTSCCFVIRIMFLI